MAEYEVQCVSVDYDSPFDDCRAIEEVGFEAVGGGFTRKTPGEVRRLIEEEGHTVYVVYHDERAEVRAVPGDEGWYVRARPEDTPEDPLLKQPSC
ncbi:MAG: hypothetical protein V5A23_09160 [Halobacteriales archaeon]